MTESPNGEQMDSSSPESQDYDPFTGASPDLPAIYLDLDGDLRLHVTVEKGGHTKDIIVCSRTLARMSPVFKAMLSGGFQESRPNEGEWVVAVLDDDYEALLTLLNIIHGRFSLVPDKPCSEDLYGILCVANKYNMTEVIKPWANSWAKLAEADKKKQGRDAAKLMFIAWELGHKDLYVAMARALVLECSTDVNGRLIAPNGLFLDDYDHIGPIDILEKIGESRKSIIQSVLNLFRDLFKTLLDGGHCHKRMTEVENSKFCDYVIIGSLYKATSKVRGSLLPESVDDITESVNALTYSAQIIVNSMVYLPDHRNCSPAPKLRSKLNGGQIMPQEAIVTPIHTSYMRTQRQKTGFHG